LRNQLWEKYKEIKKEYLRFCKAKAKKFELNQFRSEYNGPKYPGYEIVISETMC